MRPSPPAVVGRLTGRWTDPGESCAGNAHTISFAADLLSLRVVYDHVSPTLYWKDDGPGATYEVDIIGDRSIRVRLMGEGRRANDGSLVEWDLVSSDATTYCWRRSDWTGDMCTDPRTRCPAEQDVLLERYPPPGGGLPPQVTREDHLACMQGDSALCLSIAARLNPGPAVHYTLQACYQGSAEGCEATCKIDPAECD